MLAYQESLIVLIFCNPLSCNQILQAKGLGSVFIRRFVETNRAKTLAVPADQRIHLMDVAYELSKPVWTPGRSIDTMSIN